MMWRWRARSGAGALARQRIQQSRRGARADHGNDADLKAPQGEESGDADQRRYPLEPHDDSLNAERLREALRPEHMVGKENREIQDQADDGGSDARQTRREFQ